MTWELVEKPEVVPVVTPGGRVYVFYDYNGDRVATLRGKPIRADMLGWYCYKFSDDHGGTWSRERYRLPVRVTAADRGNDWQGQVQIFWGIDKPKFVGQSVIFGFSKLGKYLLDQGEGWMFRCDNIATEQDPNKLVWQMLPDGDHGIRREEFGSVQEEHNIVPLTGGGLYCIYRTTQGHPAESYSTDGGKTWTTPQPPQYADGRPLKHPRACPKLWRTGSGQLLLWYHNHGGKSFQDRNPAWLSGGIEKEGRVTWSQPEIVLYDPEPKVRTSYPDLIEQEGKYWISETQKVVARIHPIDTELLTGLWNHSTNQAEIKKGLLPNAKGPAKVELPRLPNLEAGGVTLELLIKLVDLDSNQVLLDTRDASGRGLTLSATEDNTLRIQLGDGRTTFEWDGDQDLLQAGRQQHIAVILDGGPKIVTFIVDGRLNDGGDQRQYGWDRFPAELADVNGRGHIEIPSSVSRLRIYDRALRTSEVLSSRRQSLSSSP